ncbi:MAG: hypothetical protein E7640_01040 [Ruminococcaceae bacterium]|nr:hypothetical protein [Oscillospiraceae bacterium]
MNEFLTYEYAVAPDKRSGAQRKKKTVFLLIYIFFTAALLALVLGVGMLFLPLFALAPIAVWLLVFLTWRFTDPEYEYSITSGEMTFSIIYGGKTRKKVFEQAVRSMEAVAPLTDMYRDKILDYKPQRVFEGASSHESPDAYFALFENGDGERCVYYFEATARALKILRHYNVKTVIKEVRY